MKFIKIQLCGGMMPTKGTPESAAWDLYSPINTTLQVGAMKVIGLGFRMEMHDCAAILSHRSGMNSKMGIMAYGLVDPDFRGEISVSLHNTGQKPLVIYEGDRICQMRLVEVPEATLKVVKELSETTRGEGGHGSTGD